MNERTNLIEEMIQNPRSRKFNREQFLEFIKGLRIKWGKDGAKGVRTDVENLKEGDFICNFMGKEIYYGKD